MTGWSCTVFSRWGGRCILELRHELHALLTALGVVLALLSFIIATCLVLKSAVRLDSCRGAKRWLYNQIFFSEYFRAPWTGVWSMNQLLKVISAETCSAMYMDHATLLIFEFLVAICALLWSSLHCYTLRNCLGSAEHLWLRWRNITAGCSWHWRHSSHPWLLTGQTARCKRLQTLIFMHRLHLYYFCFKDSWIESYCF